MPTRIPLTLCALLLTAGLVAAQEKLPDPTRAPIAPSSVFDEALVGMFTNGPSTSGRWDRRFWASGDYLFAWLGAANLPPLVTTSSPGSPRATAGALGAPGTNVLFEGEAGTQLRSGMRFNGGYWFNAQQSLGIEAGFIILEGQGRGYSNTVGDDSILARPFIDAGNGSQQAILIAFPGSSGGSINIRARTGQFYEAHLDLAEKALDFNWARVYTFAGYRFYSYNEGLDIAQSITTTGPPFVVGTQILTNDRFTARTDFHGLDLGLRSEASFGNFSLEVLTKFAFGQITRTVTIAGDQTVTVPGAGTVVQTGGAYALISNIGTHRQYDWSFMPELGGNLYWQVNRNLSFRVGYTGIWLEGIAHASDQIDFALNRNLFPGSTTSGGSTRPFFPNGNANIWVHAVNVGLEYRY